VHAGVSLAPGVRELIAQSVSTARLAIVSGLERATIESLLSLAELDGAFEVIIAAEDVAAVKPAPDGYRKALERMARRRPLDARAALALEPGPIGARAARAAGLRCAIIAPFRAENVADADAMLESLTGETLATLDAMLPIGSAG
jgi:beta-phosphoglucomutase-like phosphatase (HAD superfamily)